MDEIDTKINMLYDFIYSKSHKQEIEDINIYFSGLKKKLEKELELLQQETISQK